MNPSDPLEKELLKETGPVQPKRMLETLITKYFKPREYRFHDRVFSRANKELDLVKMIGRLKMLILATLGTLPTH